MKFKYVIFTIFLIFILSISTYKLGIIANAETQYDTFKIWIVTDTHMGSYSYGYTDKYVFEDAIQDGENDWEFDWNISFVLGDLTDTGAVKQYEELVDVFTVLTKHDRGDFYLIPGNHDIIGGISNYRYYVDQLGRNSQYSGMDNNKRQYYLENISDDMDGYTIRIGNTLFIMMAPSWGNKNYYDYEWWESIVNNVSSNMNVICLSHHNVEGSGIYSRIHRGMQNSEQFSNWMRENPGLIDAWFCGHAHWEYNDSGFTFVSTQWGTFFMDCASLDDGSTNKTGSKSIVLTFNKGSKNVQVDDYYHGLSTFNYHDDIEQWDNNDPRRGYQSFKLDHPFSFSPLSTIPALDTIILFDGIYSLNEIYHQIIPDTKILFTVEDIENRLKETKYKIDDGNWIKYSKSFNITDMGFHEIFFYSISKDGSSEKIQKERVKVVSIYEADDLEPYTTLTIQPFVQDPDINWYKSNVTVTLTAIDTGVGVNTTFYTFDRNLLDWNEYYDSIVLSEHGIHELFYYSVDKAGNMEDIQVVVIKIDKTKPDIDIIELPSIFLGSPLIKIFGSDISSGIDKIELYIDSKLKYTVNISNLEYKIDSEGFGEHNLKLIAYDTAGNSNIIEQKIFIINHTAIITIIFIIMILIIFLIFYMRFHKRKKNKQ